MGVAALFAVGIGAALGAWSRWGLAAALNHLLPTLPLGTLLANLTGAFLIGVAFEFIAHHATLPMEYRLFFVTGFLGSLTTFSTFSFEAVELFQGGALRLRVTIDRRASTRIAGHDFRRFRRRARDSNVGSVQG